MYYSASTNGFYSGVSASTPSDAVEVTIEDHEELMRGQMNGRMISAGEGGYPVLKDRPPLSTEQLMAIERSWRDGVLVLTDALVSRHRDEIEDGGQTTLLAEQYTELQAYRRQLRNWPEAGEFPLIEHRPKAPLWLTGQLQ